MKKTNSIFQLLVALFFGLTLVFFLTFDSLKNGFNLEPLSAGNVVVWLLVGLLLYLISLAVTMIFVKSLTGMIKKLENEKKDLKAMLFDLERGGKVDKTDKKPDTTEEDKENSAIRPRENFQ